MKARLLMVVIGTILTSNLAQALSPGRSVVVSAAARSEPWVTDLYVMNPGSTSVAVTLSWLVRGQANPNPDTLDFDLPAGATHTLEDVVLEGFGITEGGGAFRVEATGEVVVNTRIYAADGSSTFGQGFEGVPVGAMTASGQSTVVVGLTHGFGFRAFPPLTLAGGKRD